MYSSEMIYRDTLAFLREKSGGKEILNLRETADILGIPPGTAATRQRKALRLLRLDLREEVTP